MEFSQCSRLYVDIMILFSQKNLLGRYYHYPRFTGGKSELTLLPLASGRNGSQSWPSVSRIYSLYVLWHVHSAQHRRVQPGRWGVERELVFSRQSGQAVDTVKLEETMIIARKIVKLPNCKAPCLIKCGPVLQTTGIQPPETCEEGLRRVCVQIVCAPGKASQTNPVDAEENTGSVTKETGLRKQNAFPPPLTEALRGGSRKEQHRVVTTGSVRGEGVPTSPGQSSQSLR